MFSDISFYFIILMFSLNELSYQDAFWYTVFLPITYSYIVLLSATKCKKTRLILSCITFHDLDSNFDNAALYVLREVLTASIYQG